MSRIISIKITTPKTCLKCGGEISINEWATAVKGGFICGGCQTFTINEKQLPY